MSKKFYEFMDKLSDEDKLFYILMDSYRKNSLKNEDGASKIYESLIKREIKIESGDSSSPTTDLDKSFDSKLGEWASSFSEDE